MKVSQLFDLSEKRDDEFRRPEKRTTDDQPDGPEIEQDDAPEPQPDDMDMDDENPEDVADGPDFDDVEDIERRVDPTIWTMVSNDPYVTEYNHEGNDSIHPRTIVSYSKEEITQLQSKIENLIAELEMKSNNVGLYKNANYKYLSHMKAFTERVLNNM